MRGIALLNPHYRIGDLPLSESIAVQKIVTDKFMNEHHIAPVILNPYQLYPHYTIPHALLFNLRNKAVQPIDCLVLHSFEAMERFLAIYPEKWLELCWYFTEIISATEYIPRSLTPREKKGH